MRLPLEFWIDKLEYEKVEEHNMANKNPVKNSISGTSNTKGKHIELRTNDCTIHSGFITFISNIYKHLKITVIL